MARGNAEGTSVRITVGTRKRIARMRRIGESQRRGLWLCVIVDSVLPLVQLCPGIYITLVL